MIIGTIKETNDNEKRVAITPETCKKIISLGYEVVLQKDSGKLSNYLDQEYLDKRVLFILENMNALQASIHLWVTMTLDVVFPLAYGFLFFGILLNNLESQWRFLAVLPLILIAADLTEGIFQIQLLKAETTEMKVVSYKNKITLIKYILFLICMGMCLLTSMLKLGGSGKT